MAKKKLPDGFFELQLVDYNHDPIGIIRCPIPHQDAWIVFEGKLYQVQAIWFYDNQMPRVTVGTPFKFGIPTKMKA